MSARVPADDSPPAPGPARISGVERVKPSYAQVAAQLRALILERQVAAGERLPAEGELSKMFGVSRSTTREALRLLAAENLVETRRGVTGGTFVAHPDPEEIRRGLATSVDRAAGSGAIAVEDVHEVWRITQTPAGRLAAERRTDAHVEQLLELSALDTSALSDAELAVQAMRFHEVMLAAAGNRLLELITRSLSGISARTLGDPRERRPFLDAANARHRAIAEAIAAGDGDLAEKLVADDLDEPARALGRGSVAGRPSRGRRGDRVPPRPATR